MKNWHATRSSSALSRAGRITRVGLVVAAALATVAAPAAAAESTTEDLTGVTISCGDTLLTFTGGVQVGDLHRVLLGNGREVVILSAVLHGATLADEAGRAYRAVGGANSTARVTTEGDPGSLAGHFNVNITVLDDAGRFGKVVLRERTSRDGTIDLVTGGGCSF